MFRKLYKQLKEWTSRKRSRGQAIVEYCMIIAFVGVLIAFVFALTRNTLFCGVSESFSSVTSQLNRLTNATYGLP